MTSVLPDATIPKLSICISTHNRAHFIGATLESITSQISHECEVVILDAASTDRTPEVVSAYARRFPHVRYIRQDTNNGIDRDFDQAVQLAEGEYCWLMSDDDLFKEGAIITVLSVLSLNISLVLLNYERRDSTLSKTLLPRLLEFQSDRVYVPGEMDRLLSEVGPLLMYIGCVIIKRSIWLSRDRTRYYGSMFIHVGVVFQEQLPGDAMLIAKPLIIYRQGNTTTFDNRAFEILMVRWPSVVWSLAASKTAKLKVCHEEPWRGIRLLLLYRAMGWYFRTDYHRWIHPHLRSLWGRSIRATIASLPGVLVNSLYIFYFSVCRKRNRAVMLKFLVNSPFYLRNWSFRRPTP